MHAAIAFALRYPDVATASPVVVLLAAPDELGLTWLRADAIAAGLRVISFHEPDLGHALTALALEPAAGRLLTGLPLALSGSLTSTVERR